MMAAPRTNGIHPADANNGETAPLIPTTNDHHHPRRSSNSNNTLLFPIPHEGESGRAGFHLRHFLLVLWRSSCHLSKISNILWPFVPLALFFRIFFSDSHPLWTFYLSYIGMIPSANLLGFAGQELARKMPKVAGILIETTFGSIVEIILFLVLIVKHDEEDEAGNMVPIIQAAILGSILTNLLLCLGLCFFVGGIRHVRQRFHAIVSEVGSGLLLVAAFGLLIPSAFYSALKSEASVVEVVLGPGVKAVMPLQHDEFTLGKLEDHVLRISRVTSIALILSFFMYIWYCASSQHSIFDEVIEADEHRDADREADMEKPKFTATEATIALVISLVCATALLIFLVDEIEHVVHSGVPDQFLGLILLPLVEKAAEHLTAIDEAWDGVINVALYHCLGPSIQTALFNGPLVVIVGWALGKPMDLNFEIFMIGLLVLSILVVGNFLRDGESNWLEGALLVMVYVITAIACWYYPNPDIASSNSLERLEMINVTIADGLQELKHLLTGV
ncbi:putative vacuolar calcium ion transporter [Triangularia setosa]|uniref:Vacuolar calcium ion transporter n=1 Tax=Triangularia setosa TaxID=2587417 RepID=A0AAN6W087_9PEZI|nr:putative vacuolar calcium ion transporter [Podospora setosa]